jgi:hypothetical protein
LPQQGPTLWAVTCPSSERCIAVGGAATARPPAEGEVITSDDGGVFWSAPQLVPDVNVAGLACSSTTRCETWDSPDAWFASQSYEPGYHATSIGSLLMSAGRRATWRRQLSFGGSVGVAAGMQVSISCGSGSNCVAVGERYDDESPTATWVERTSDAGSNWAAVSSLAGRSASRLIVSGVSCPAVRVCEMVGYLTGTTRGFAVRSTDGGATWSWQSLPRGTSELTAVTCTSTEICEAVGSFGTLSNPSGSSGSAGTINGNAPPPPSFAMRTTGGGARWVFQRVPASATGLEFISCSSASVCEAGADAANLNGPDLLGEDVIGTIDGGASWSVQPVPAGVLVADVACAPGGSCAGVGYDLADLSSVTLVYR